MSLSIEVAYASPSQQILIPLQVEPGTTIQQAIQQSKILEHCAEIDLGTMAVGVFGEVKALNALVEENDRIEIYRTLLHDPKELRRQRAEQNPFNLTKKQKNRRKDRDASSPFKNE